MPTHDEYQDLFNQVCDPLDWKGPIDAVVNVEIPWLNDIMDAITYFTGIPATDIEVECISSDKWIIKCVGYRNGPCGP